MAMIEKTIYECVVMGIHVMSAHLEDPRPVLKDYQMLLNVVKYQNNFVSSYVIIQQNG